jgi:beta-glucosidase
VQIYATPPAATRSRERQALSGFDRVHLNAGATKTVEITVGPTALRRWNVEGKAYVVPAGQWTIAAGASASDIRQSISARKASTANSRRGRTPSWPA